MPPHAPADTTRPHSQPTSHGDALMAELRWVHDAIRRDLETVRNLSVAVRDGVPPGGGHGRDLRPPDQWPPLETARQLSATTAASSTVTTTARILSSFPSCAAPTPPWRPSSTSWRPTIVSSPTTSTRSRPRSIPLAGKIPAARERIVAGLDGLAEHLLAHLAFEEREIAPTVLTWERWPGAEWKGASSL